MSSEEPPGGNKQTNKNKTLHMDKKNKQTKKSDREIIDRCKKGKKKVVEWIS